MGIINEIKYKDDFSMKEEEIVLLQKLEWQVLNFDAEVKKIKINISKTLDPESLDEILAAKEIILFKSDDILELQIKYKDQSYTILTANWQYLGNYIKNTIDKSEINYIWPWTRFKRNSFLKKDLLSEEEITNNKLSINDGGVTVSSHNFTNYILSKWLDVHKYTTVYEYKINELTSCFGLFDIKYT